MARSIFDKSSPAVITGSNPAVVAGAPAPKAAPVKQNWIPPATNNNSGTVHATPPQQNPQPDRIGPSPLAAGAPPLAGGFKPLPTIDKVGLAPTNTIGKSPVPMADNNLAAVPPCLQDNALVVAEISGNKEAQAYVDAQKAEGKPGWSDKVLGSVKDAALAAHGLTLKE